jgi:hypothetical protein
MSYKGLLIKLYIMSKQTINVKSNGLRNELKDIRKSIDKLTNTLAEIHRLQTNKHEIQYPVNPGGTTSFGYSSGSNDDRPMVWRNDRLVFLDDDSNGPSNEGTVSPTDANEV